MEISRRKFLQLSAMAGAGAMLAPVLAACGASDTKDKKETGLNHSSTISVEDLKDLTSAKFPTKSKRKQKSDKNIVSLQL